MIAVWISLQHYSTYIYYSIIIQYILANQQIPFKSGFYLLQVAAILQMIPLFRSIENDQLQILIIIINGALFSQNIIVFILSIKQRQKNEQLQKNVQVKKKSKKSFSKSMLANVAIFNSNLELELITVKTANQNIFLKEFFESNISEPCSYTIQLMTLVQNSLDGIIAIQVNSTVKEFLNQYFSKNKEWNNKFEFTINCENQEINKSLVNVIPLKKSKILIQWNFLNQKYIQDREVINNIFASLSHEFGTYLNALSCIVEAGLQDSKSNQEYFSQLQINSDFLNLLLGNVRDLSQILNNQFTLQLEEFNIKHEIELIVKNVDAIVKSRNSTIVYKSDLRDSELDIYSDKQRFRQIIFQLISNAIRFTQHGIITIAIIEQKNKSFLIDVSDTGIGMNQQEKNSLKELMNNKKLFQQKVSQHSVGCAMGLTISNQIAIQLSGLSKIGIQFSSIQNQGSKFNFVIENQRDRIILNSKQSNHCTKYNIILVDNSGYYEVNSPSPFKRILNQVSFDKLQQKAVNLNKRRCKSEFLICNSEYKTDIKCFEDDCNLKSQEDISITIREVPKFSVKFQSETLKQKIEQSCCSKILIVDDEYFNIISLKLILEKFRLKSEFAFNGNDALQKVKQKQKVPCIHCQNNSYLIYFLDINMPVMDGYKTVEQLKLMMKNKEIEEGVCIANTAFIDLKTKVNCYEAGMDYYFTKPLKFRDIQACFEKIIKI